jgi:hypothetical protein
VLSPVAAEIVMTALVIAAAVATLYVLDVRDWRVYGAMFLWTSVLSGIQTANLTLPLCLVAALAWRFRSRHLLSGVLVGAAFALKVFTWPLVFWLVATRRYRATVAALLTGAASILLILPFGSPIAYFQLAHRNAEVVGKRAFSVYVLLGSSGAARAAWLAVAAVVLLAALARAEDRSSFVLALAAWILFSSIVWLHYFALLLVPLALARPRFGALWLVPLAYWLVPFGTPSRWQIAVALGAMSCVIVASLAREPAPGRPGVAEVAEPQPALGRFRSIARSSSSLH